MVTLCSGSWIYPLLRGCLCLHEPAWSPHACSETFPPECIRTINLLDYLHKQPVLLIFTFVAKLSNSIMKTWWESELRLEFSKPKFRTRDNPERKNSEDPFSTNTAITWHGRCRPQAAKQRVSYQPPISLQHKIKKDRTSKGFTSHKNKQYGNGRDRHRRPTTT